MSQQHPNDGKPNLKKAMQMIADAQRRGTHGPIENWRTVCPKCGEWVSGIYHSLSQGSRIRLCRACASKAGIA
jgi:hypothetical protein